MAGRLDHPLARRRPPVTVFARVLPMTSRQTNVPTDQQPTSAAPGPSGPSASQWRIPLERSSSPPAGVIERRQRGLPLPSGQGGRVTSTDQQTNRRVHHLLSLPSLTISTCAAGLIATPYRSLSRRFPDPFDSFSPDQALLTMQLEVASGAGVHGRAHVFSRVAPGFFLYCCCWTSPHIHAHPVSYTHLTLPTRDEV